MARRLSILDNVRIASPCPASWAEMVGDERVRHCKSCNLNVFNLSEMTRVEAEELIRTRQNGRLCIGYYQRADGTIITRDCPVGLRLIRRGLVRLGGIAASLLLLMLGGARSNRQVGPAPRLSQTTPIRRVINALAPPPKQLMRGEAVIMVPPGVRPSYSTRTDDPNEPAAPNRWTLWWEWLTPTRAAKN